MADRRDNDRIAVERKSGGSSAWVWILGAIALAAIALFLLIPLFNGDEALTPGNATISEITSGLSEFEGQSVLLNGQVAEVLSPSSFVMTGGATGEAEAVADESILVIGAQQNLAAIDDQALNDSVLVGGIVREFNIAEVENEIGYGLDDGLYADWEGRPVVVATAAQLVGAPASAASNATIPEILQAPDQYMGRNVIVGGQTSNVLDTNGVVVTANAIEAGVDPVDAGLLVLGGQEGLFSFDDAWLNQGVLASGVVTQYPDLATLESEIGYDLDDAIYTPFVNRPVLLASAMQQATAMEGVGAVDGSAGLMEYQNATVADIAGNTEALLGQRVAVQAGVESVISANAFSLDEDSVFEGGIDNDVLVLSANQNNAMINDDLGERQVVVVGTVRMFNLADVESELGYDLDDNLYADWEGRPAIVAQAVRPVEPMGETEVAAPVAPIAPATEVEAIEPAPMREAALAEGNVTVAEIASNLTEFAGREVVVTSGVEEVISPTAFSLDEDATFAGGIDNDLLVLSANESPAMAFTDLADQTVLVRGTVQAFNLVNFENELGYDLDDGLFTDWEGRPAIIATAVEPLEPMAEAASIAPEFANVTVAEIASDLPTYAGQTVAVREEVEEVISPTAFSLDEDAFFAGGIDNDLLVLSANQSPAMAFTDLDGESVTVIGTVRAFNIVEFENELGYDLDDNLFTDWEGRPAIIADNVVPATAEYGYGVAE